MKVSNRWKVWWVSLTILTIILLVLLLSGCQEREEGELIKEGRVTKIEYDIVFGACFTDWRNEIYFDDGTVLWTNTEDDLDCIKYNLTGIFHFEKDYFKYEDAWYKFHDFQYVEYLE
jgi:hypothetical protein